MIDVRVTRVQVIGGETIGYAWGTTDEGEDVFFAGDQRPMRALGEAVGEEGSIDVVIDEWQVIGRGPAFGRKVGVR